MRPPMHAPMDPPGRRKRRDRREHAIRERDGSQRERGRGSGRGDSGSIAEDVSGVHNAPPSPEHSLGQPASHRVRYSHADEGSKARRSPRRAIQQRDGHSSASALAQVREEALRLGPERTMRRDGQRDAPSGRYGRL